tara:strand:+ start:89 stop:601 length:513 start_codon:yes stop_codon:yes gene_type:complete
MTAGAALIAASAFHYLGRLDSGDLAPAFTLPLSSNGEPVSLVDYQDKLVLLHFWATWCEPCREEFPSLEQLNLNYQDKGLVILSVSEDTGINAGSLVESFRKVIPFSFPALLDTKAEVANLYQAYGVPETIIIERGGKIAGRLTGAQNWNSSEAKQLIEELLKLPSQPSN